MSLQKLFTKILHKIIGRSKPNFFIQPKHEVELAFECGGRKYYKFVNELNIPCERAFSALDIYNELDMKTSKDYLALHCEAVESAINSGELIKVAQLNQVLKMKSKNITEINIMYKLASVLYFDEDENPYVWDATYAKKKIEHWQKHKDIASFFLQTPLKEYLPSLSFSQGNLQNYMAVQQKTDLAGLKLILQTMQAEGKNKELVTSLQSQITHLMNILGLEN